MTLIAGSSGYSVHEFDTHCEVRDGSGRVITTTEGPTAACEIADDLSYGRATEREVSHPCYDGPGSVDVDDAHAEALADALPGASVDTNNCPTYPCEGHMRRTECLGRLLMECNHCGRTYVHVLTDGGEWYRTGSSYALVRDGEIIREVSPRHWRDAYLTV